MRRWVVERNNGFAWYRVAGPYRTRMQARWMVCNRDRERIRKVNR